VPRALFGRDDPDDLPPESSMVDRMLGAAFGSAWRYVSGGDLLPPPPDAAAAAAAERPKSAAASLYAGAGRLRAEAGRGAASRGRHCHFDRKLQQWHQD
jgi:hypothetical protein